MKTQEELSVLKEEVDCLKEKLSGLTEDELAGITGGIMPIIFASLNSEQNAPQTSETCYGFLSNRPIE